MKPHYSQEGRALTDMCAERVVGGLTCPEVAPRKHHPHTRFPGARTPAEIQTFSFIDAGFEALL